MARRMVDAAAPGIVGRYVLVGYRDDGRSQDGRLRCYMAGSPLSSRLCVIVRSVVLLRAAVGRPSD